MEKTFKILKLTDCITTRDNRMALERIFAVLFTLSNKINNIKTTSVFGDIHTNYIPSNPNSHWEWGQGYGTYLFKKNNNEIILPIEKVWSGR